jgi:adenylate cyclase
MYLIYIPRRGNVERVNLVPPMEPRWEAMLRGEHRLAYAHRVGRRAFGLLPSPWRCKFCNAPFNGPAAGIVRWVGYEPSRKNPAICARCIEHAPEGGAVVPLSVLFADVRGYTTLSEDMPPLDVKMLLSRFYAAASRALLSHDGLLAQVAGDQVMALFVPGLAGSEYRRRAVEGARSLLGAIGYGDREGSWLGVGVGVASGEEFVGNVGGGGYKDFTAVGDITNIAARLTSRAAAGEIVVDSPTYDAVRNSFPRIERRDLSLKGKSGLVSGFVIPGAAA